MSANIQLNDRSGLRDDIEPMMDSSEEIDDMIVNVAEIADWLTTEEGIPEADRLMEIEEQLTAFMEDVPRIWPVEGRRISSPFGTRNHPILNGRSNHTGVDIPDDYGAPIVATAEGLVTYAGYQYGYGYTVKIEHANGVETVYAHASKLLVKVGDEVIQGQQIAKVGSTGLSTGPHIHYEIRINGAYIDPELFLEQE
jgi:murein DD-endopeptidase MepM/ murein hydrolase activator NlpD